MEALQLRVFKKRGFQASICLATIQLFWLLLTTGGDGTCTSSEGSGHFAPRMVGRRRRMQGK